jgi:hypothetical protein
MAKLALLIVAAWLTAASAARGRPQCSSNIVSIISGLFAPPVQHPPLLSKYQMLWMSSIVETTQALYPDRPVNFLVFGLGVDTPGWMQVNCRGRTIFLEHSADWVKLVTENIARDYNSTVESYSVSYKGDMSKPNEFFDRPWLMPVPEAVSQTCFDVILVDAPTGFDPLQRECALHPQSCWLAAAPPCLERFHAR